MATWNIDPAHSHVSFRVRHLLISKVRGSFGSYSATLDYDPANPAAASVTASIAIDSIDTGVGDRDAHLKSADFFDAASHPNMGFQSTAVRADGDAFAITGDLTIRGNTRAVTLKAERTGETKDPWGNTRIAFEAKTRISRKEFGLSWNALLETGGAVVGDDVDIEIEAELVRAG
ncbi:MAG: YceI family protein [Deltaproteobacteria bacterium]|nr:YceI family protein [Deltaproteobacteria bacterium]